MTFNHILLSIKEILIRNYVFLFIITTSICFSSCNKATCPDPIVYPGVYIIDSADYNHCGCRILTAHIIDALPDHIQWKDQSSNTITGNMSLKVCPNVTTEYNLLVNDANSDVSTSVTISPISPCDKKQLTICSKVLIQSMSDILQLHNAVTQAPPVDPSSVPLAYSSAYGGVCTPNDTVYGSAKLNGIYAWNNNSNRFYKTIPLPLSCSFTAENKDRDSIKAPSSSDFINGIPAYLQPGDRVFANIAGPIPGRDTLFTIFWNKVGSGYVFLGSCAPDKEFIIQDKNSPEANEIYYFYFFTIKPGCSYEDAYNNSNCKTSISYNSIKRIFNAHVDGNFCNSAFPSNYDFTGNNVKVTMELLNGSFIDAYLCVDKSSDGSTFFKYKEDRTDYTCP